MSEDMVVQNETSSTPDPFAQYVNDLFARANGENIPSGILHWSTFIPYRIAEFDGIDWRGVCDQPTWMQLYTEVLNGQKRDLGLVSTDGLRTVAAAYQERGETPIAIAAFDYHTPKRTFVARVLAGARNEQLPDIEGLTAERILEGKRAFFVSALLPDASNGFELLPHVHYGQELRFIVPRALFFSNLEVPADVEIDFDDGNGFRRVAFDEVVDVTYADTLPKQIRVRAEALAGACRLTLRERVAPRPDQTWALAANHVGRPVHGTAWVFYGKGHTAISDPVIFADGFGEGSTNIDGLYALLNQEGLADKIRERGKDLIILGYRNKADWLQANGLVAVECIQRTIRERAGTKPLHVAGASMGALVVRYALALMEKQGTDHQTTRYLSYDGQHGEGAWLSIIIQNFVYYLENETDFAKRMANLNRTGAAQQLLWGWLPDWRYSGPISNNPHKLAFRNELPHGGFPQKPRRYAIANGTGNGVPNATPPAKVAVNWHGNLCVGAELCTVPPLSSDHRYIGKIWLKELAATHFYLHNAQPFDSAPGGLSYSFGAAGDAARSSGYGWTDIHYRSECFVPTISALGMKTSNIFTDIPSFGVDKTDFHEIAWSSTNTGHCIVTPELLKWFLDRIAPIAAEEEAENAA